MRIQKKKSMLWGPSLLRSSVTSAQIDERNQQLEPEVRGKRLISFWLILLCVVIVVPTRTALAQVLYGSIVGSVRDSTSAVLNGAPVSVVNQDTKQVRTTQTNQQGDFSVSNLIPGTYDITVKSPGFRPYVQTGVQVQVNVVSRIDAQLSLGPTEQSVTVSASNEQLQTDTPEIHAEITGQAVTTLPLTQYRNYQSLVNLVPGATPGGLQNAINDTSERSLVTNVNGTVASNTNTRLDGALNKYNIVSTHVLYVPPAESIETVNVVTDAFDAEQGMAGGAAITVITKSGTNDFHGSVFAYNSNNKLQARNYFFAGSRSPKSILNDDGFALGGPIKKNKLFFFIDWDGVWDRTNYSSLLTVPTADQRNGDFSAYSSVIYDPATGNADGTGRTPFAGNIIPKNRLSSIALQMQNLVPLPNLPGTTSNYFASGTQVMNRHNYDAKLTWNRTNNHTIWGKYSAMDSLINCTASLGAAGGPGLCNGGGGTGTTLVQIATLGHTWTLNSNLVVDGTIGYSRIGLNFGGLDYGKNFGTDVLGIPGTNGTDIRQSGMPMFVPTGYTTTGDPNPWVPIIRNDDTYTLSSNVSWNTGRHDVRAGVDAIYFRQSDWQPSVGGGPRGEFDFTGGVTALNGGKSPSQYNAYAQYLLGLPGSTSKALQFYSPQTAREWQFGLYARDRWQVSKALAVTLGVRYEYYPMMTRENTGIERYDPSSNIVYIGGKGGVPENAGVSTSKLLFVPRAGFAYRINDNTVLRAGYGISIDPDTVSGGIQRPYPAAFASTYNPANSFLAVSTLAQGITTFSGPDINSGTAVLPTTASTVTLPANKLRRGYIESMNVTMERKLPLNLIASVGYVGTLTVRQFGIYDANAGVAGKGLAGMPYYAKYGRSVPTSIYDGLYPGNYRSLQATLNRHFSTGLFLKGAYTFSRAIDFVDTTPGAGSGTLLFNDPSQYAKNRALAGFDRTHILQMAGSYNVPSNWSAKKRLLNQLVRNWAFNSTFSAYSGTPFTVTASSASLNAPDNTQTADQVKTQVSKLGGIGAGHPYYDASAFAPVTEPRFGTAGRNILRGPHIVNVNLGIFRQFSLTERLKLQVRSEAFNLSNTPHFSNPSANASNPASFMTITSALSDQRQIRFGLRMGF